MIRKLKSVALAALLIAGIAGIARANTFPNREHTIVYYSDSSLAHEVGRQVFLCVEPYVIQTGTITGYMTRYTGSLCSSQ